MDEDESLITFVKDHEELYNLAHPQYLNKTLKEIKWKTIASRLDKPVAVCKSRWYNIRDNFRKALRKRSPRKKFRKYKFENHLTFLLPFMQELENLNNSEPTTKVEEIEVGETKVELEDSNFSDEHNDLGMKTIPEVKPAQSAMLMKHLPDLAQPESVDAFLIGLAPTLKSFSPYNLNIAKSRIFTIVQEMELEQIKQRYSTDCKETA